MVLTVEQESVQTVSTNEVTQAVHSEGAVIQVTKLGRGVGMPVLSVACPPAGGFLSALSSPVYAMELRGYAGSRVAKV
jgi:hypothetical protein